MNENLSIRGLNTEDIFTLIDMSNEMNVTDIIDKVMDMTKAEKEKQKAIYKNKPLPEDAEHDITSKVGVKAAFMILQSLGKAKEHFYKLLSDVSNMSVDEIKNQPLINTINMIVQLVSQNEFKSFLSDLTNKVI
jgi:macrodomain Ter protein organizer (MatP/YcbG family)